MLQALNFFPYRYKKILIVLVVAGVVFKISHDVFNFSNRICQTNNDIKNSENKGFNLYEKSLNKLLCFYKLNESKLELRDITITVRHSNKQDIIEIKNFYLTWYQFAVSQVSL